MFDYLRNEYIRYPAYICLTSALESVANNLQL